MNSPGLLIAAGVLALYIIMGPVVLFGIYAFFDRLAQRQDQEDAEKKSLPPEKKDPALWTIKDVKAYMKELKQQQE